MRSLPSRALARDLLRYPLGQIELGTPQRLSVDASPGWPVEHLLFETSHHQSIRALFLPPPRPSSAAMLYCHAHGGAYDIGIDELIHGRAALSSPWLNDLADLGMAVLCIEMPCFGSRLQNESALAKAMLWRGETLFGLMLAELWAAFDWLCEQPDIDAGRIGCMGISMGGTHAWWLAALDPRVHAAISLCALADLGTLIDQGYHDKHGPYMTVPGLLAHGRTGQWAGLAAPTPLFIGLGQQDWSSPPSAIEQVEVDITQAYGSKSERLHWHIEPASGHIETADMRRAARQFIAHAMS